MKLYHSFVEMGKCDFSEIGRKEISGESGVYMILDLNSMEKYIGSSRNINKRINDHITALNNNRHWNKFFQELWNKSNHDDFVVIVLEFTDENKRLEREEYYINHYGIDKLLNRTKSVAEPMPHNKRAIKQIDPITNDVIKCFSSIADACIEFKTSASNISRSLKDNTLTAVGFVWQYC